MKKNSAFALIGITLAVAGAYLIWERAPSEVSVASASGKSSFGPVQQVASEPREAITSTSAPTPLLKDRVEALLKEGTPTSKLDAHNIVANCARKIYIARRFSGQAADQECVELAGIYGSQYMHWLQAAIDAKVPGAAHAFLSAGPFGDLTNLDTRFHDPLVEEWKQQVISLLEGDAKAGDLQALQALNDQYRDGALVDVDIPKAFGALVVAREKLLASGETKLSAASLKELNALSKRLNQEQMNQAYSYADYLKGKGSNR
ncbi:hypothetical protein OU995_03545 [Roseateles sp. SL47]|uniref:hypothetical protein n=1 Tax=Roseateles sp. SL47 TaxID=2995138 RepID=UPI0022703753|nr:hypothetical protein [Roseateles sp. SL47]WAC73823.1 hypothetical protein OU995_03545 [Roseateles sp. SL47]